MVVVYFLLSDGKRWRGYCERLLDHPSLTKHDANWFPNECLWLIPGTHPDDPAFRT